MIGKKHLSRAMAVTIAISVRDIPDGYAEGVTGLSVFHECRPYGKQIAESRVAALHTRKSIRVDGMRVKHHAVQNDVEPCFHRGTKTRGIENKRLHQRGERFRCCLI